MGRKPCCEKVGLTRGKWSAEEDQRLSNYVAKHGEGSWRSLPKKAGILRCFKSCRLRWLNYLRPGVKRGNISKEEQNIIIMLHTSIGNRWSMIASQLPGRTDYEIKNYWNSHLSRQIHFYRRTYTSGPDDVTIDITKLHSARKRHGGRTPGRKLMKTASSSSSRNDTNNKQPLKPGSPAKAKDSSILAALDGQQNDLNVDVDKDHPSSSVGSNNMSDDDRRCIKQDKAGVLDAAESEMEGLLSSCSVVGESETMVDDLPDIDQTNKLQAADSINSDELQTFMTWLLAD